MSSIVRSVAVIDEAARRHLGLATCGQLEGAPPEALSAVEDRLGRSLPPTLGDLYRISDGFAAFGFELVPASEIADGNTILPGGRLGLAPPIGPPPPPGSFVVDEGEGVYLIIGPDDSVTVFELMTNRYTPAAPSVEALFDAWAELSMTGHVAPMAWLDHDPGVMLDYSKTEDAAIILARHGCSLSAVWCLPGG